jgi:hypothetical protein
LHGDGSVPSEFERLRPSHVSAEHTLLNIEVAEFLQQEGYTIMTEVPVIELPQGGKFIPDIVAEKGSEVYFIEVERGTSKDTKARQAKWLNFYTASAGQLYVFCDNLECMCGIRKELLDALGSSPGIVCFDEHGAIEKWRTREGWFDLAGSPAWVCATSQARARVESLRVSTSQIFGVSLALSDTLVYNDDKEYADA